MDSTISDLKDLITAASISLSPAIAWLTFYSLWREKRRERLSSIRQRLLEVKEEMEYIGNWARAEYNEESSHD
ncbi:MAG: hypothetical protein K9N36_05780, partial [Candidatus Marinimicrobia bacterium]|nr:hypothetical protein [Candidatus Neomarinimicrobiota bacterium]